MGNFYVDVIQADARFNSPNPCRDTALLEPNTRSAVASIIADASTQGIALIVTETFRSAARQQALFAQHLTQLNGLTPATIGVHHFGLACDFARLEGGRTDWATDDWLFLGPLAAKYGMVWGGDWGVPAKLHAPGFHDWDHCQSCSVTEQPALFSGLWYPSSVLPTEQAPVETSDV